MNTIFEQMGGRYIQHGDYLIPDLALSNEEHYPIGKYGLMRMNYLKEHRPVIYNQLILSASYTPIWVRSSRPARNGWIG